MSLQKQSVYVFVNALEMARGYDGLLRQTPEPVLVIGAYAVAGGRVLLVERRVVRFQAPNDFPGTVRPICDSTIDARFAHESQAALVLLVIALEEDGGEDIQRAFGCLERHDTLSLWDASARDVVPMHLHECVAHQAFDRPRAVHLMFDAREASRDATSDKWIGAAICVLQRRGIDRLQRFPFLSADERNDWTALLSVYF
jgi:hypothetical protein